MIIALSLSFSHVPSYHNVLIFFKNIQMVTSSDKLLKYLYIMIMYQSLHTYINTQSLHTYINTHIAVEQNFVGVLRTF